MKIVYDMSVFGACELQPNTKAGTHRYAEQLAQGLINSKQCSLVFSAFEGNLQYYALKHLDSFKMFQDIYFPYSHLHYKVFNLMLKMEDRISSSSGFKKLWGRGLRKLLRHSSESFNADSVIEKHLKVADIFHSPYFPIPAKVTKQRNLKAFLTVLDLIPILYPQFFVGPAVDYFKLIMNEIEKKNWVICISNKTKEDLCNYRKDLDPNRIFVTHLGASDWFEPCIDTAEMGKVRLKYKIPSGEYFLSVCTLEPRKNLPHLIRCFSRLIQQEPMKDLMLVLVGGLGWKYESIFAELTSVEDEVRKRIVFAGRVADEDMAALYSGAIAFVYPSIYEGFGLPPLEAMQCGTPVITSNTSSLPEVVGTAGIMVDPYDIDGLCDAMLKVATKPDLRQGMSVKSLEQARLFSWTNCANQTLAAYNTAINSDR